MGGGAVVTRRLARALGALAAVAGAAPLRASDHLDSPLVIADKRLDIGDLYGWMSDDAQRLNLVMTIVGHDPSDRAAYVFHIDSGAAFGATRASIALTCRFAAADRADCRLGRADRVAGDPRDPRGLTRRKGRFRVFAGLRDDPFFNNVRGTRDAYNAAIGALRDGARMDAAGCPAFSAAQTGDILARWRRTDGGPATNFLRGWTPFAIVVSIDVAKVSRGGPMLAVWAATAGPGEQIDRAARPLTGNALLATIGTAEEGNALKIRYNRAAPREGDAFVEEIAKGVALYDGFDGRCGDGFLIDRAAPAQARYRPLARLLADDRLWIDSRFGRCTELFAVERAALRGEAAVASDCGGRTLTLDALQAYRSLLANGTTSGISDGLRADEKTPSRDFPFLAEPDPVAATGGQ